MPFSPDLVFLPPYGYDFSRLMLILLSPGRSLVLLRSQTGGLPLRIPTSYIWDLGLRLVT